MQARRALVGPQSELVLVCMYVCLSVYGFTHSLRTFWHVLLRMPSSDVMEIEVEDSEDRRRRQNESRCMEDG